jgi:hypothetical protein
MIETFVHYLVEPDRVEEIEELNKEFLTELSILQPGSVAYLVYRMGENIFIHIRSFQNDKVQADFFRIAAFQKLINRLTNCLLEIPIENSVKTIGCYQHCKEIPNKS